MDKLTLNHLESIENLLSKKEIKYSSFGSKKLLKYFIEMDVVDVFGRPKKIELKNENRLFNIIKSFGFNINDIEGLRGLLKNINNFTRDEIANIATNTKQIASESFKGMFIGCLNPLEVFVDKKLITIYPIANGVSTFVHFATSLELQKNTIVIGVENPQVLWYLQRYEHLFNNKDYLFILIKNIYSSYERDWLETIDNEYIHFGDYDLAAISIFLNEILPRIKDCKSSYLFNDYIKENIVENGERELYSKQIMKYKNLKTNMQEVQEIIEFIKNVKKSLEQEFLAEN